MVLRQIRFSTTRHWFFIAFVLVLGTSGGDAGAFVRSEDELMRAEVTEAKSRAKDFKRYKESAARIESERDRGVNEIKERRRRFEEEQEAARRRYVETRGDRAKQEEAQSRFEAEDEKRLLKAMENMDKIRLEYLKKRDSVQATLDREAHIDPAEEYDIHPLPTAHKGGPRGASSPNSSFNPGSFNENF